MTDTHAITELYQHIITAVLIIVPVLGAFAIFAWRVSWRMGRFEQKLGMLWKAFCKAHNLDPTNGD